MKSFSISQVWSLVFVFASTIAAIPVDTNDDLSRGDNACAALGKCRRQEPSSLAPNTTSSTPDLTAPVGRAAMTPYMFGCTGEQQIKVQEAWIEAGDLADAHAKWNPPSTFKSESFQPAMSMYIGSDSSKDKPFFGQGPLKRNVLREQGIHRTNQDWSPFWSYAYFYCDESKLPSKFKPEKPHCGGPGQPGQNVAAYTFYDDGRLSWNAKYVVFCPRFFQPDVLSLADRVASALENPALQKVIDPWRRVRASIMVHETYHWGPAEVSDPRCDRRPEIYDAAGVVKLAATENVAGSRTNAESWAQAGIATYMQQRFNLPDPPVPMKQATADIQAALNDTSVDDIETLFFDQPPDWFAPPAERDMPPYSSDMTDVKQIDPTNGEQVASA